MGQAQSNDPRSRTRYCSRESRKPRQGLTAITCTLKLMVDDSGTRISACSGERGQRQALGVQRL
jgi:hypothetical protein